MKECFKYVTVGGVLILGSAYMIANHQETFLDVTAVLGAVALIIYVALCAKRML